LLAERASSSVMTQWFLGGHAAATAGLSLALMALLLALSATSASARWVQAFD